MIEHPTLYKKTSTGALQQWTVKVDGNTIISRWGQVGGTIQETRDVIVEGKNVGKRNETTPAQQAEKEAQSLWEKKLKKDYVRTIDEAEQGNASELVAGGILPMLAHRYDKHAEKIVFPAYAQPKLDGHRCIATLDKKGKCALWTRTRKPIKTMPHIVGALEEMGCRDIVLDGELYNHEYKDKFEVLTHLIKRDAPAEGHEVVQYHVYDWAGEQVPMPSYQERWEILRDVSGQAGWDDRTIPENLPYCTLVLVETIEVADEDELMLAFERFLEQGYEGAIVRNKDGAYVNKRSYDLQKVKQFDDAEFKVVGVTEGRGKLAGHAIFVCVTPAGAEFEAKMKGPIADLKQYWEKPDLAVGRTLTVQFQGYTKKSKVPRFPVAERFREDL